ncbi:hypothetical protein, partial [Mycobacterium tuberculosis]
MSEIFCITDHSEREEISAALDAYHASLSRVLDLKCDALTTPELL